MQSLTSRVNEACNEESAITLDQIKVESKKLSIMQGIGILGGIGDQLVSMDLYDPIQNRWKGKQSLINFKREGYKAINHPQ